MGSIKRPSGFDSTMTEPSQVTTVLRGPTSSPTSSIYTQHPTTASTPPSKHSQLSSRTCSLVPAGTSKSYSRLWLTRMTGAWPARSRIIVSSMTKSWPSPSRSNNTSEILTPSEHGSRHVSPTLCLLTPLNASPHYRTCLGSMGQYILDGREVVARCMASMFALHCWRMSRDVCGRPS
jgi:hypothetical protein